MARSIASSASNRWPTRRLCGGPRPRWCTTGSGSCLAWTRFRSRRCGLELPGQPAVAIGRHGRDDGDDDQSASPPGAVSPATSGVPPAPAPEPLRRARPAATGSAGSRGTARSSSRSSAAVANRSSGSLASALSDDRLQVAGDAAVDAAGGGGGLVGDLVDELGLVRLVEGRPQGQQLVERRPQARRCRCGGRSRPANRSGAM